MCAQCIFSYIIYVLYRWEILAQVVLLSPLRISTSQGKTTKLFYFDVQDTSGVIRCAAMNETAEELQSVIQVSTLNKKVVNYEINT